MNLLKRYSKQAGFAMLCVSILLFAPMIQVVIVTGIIVMFTPHKLSPEQGMVFVGESFLYYMLTIPGIALAVMGAMLMRKSRNNS